MNKNNINFEQLDLSKPYMYKGMIALYYFEIETEIGSLYYIGSTSELAWRIYNHKTKLISGRHYAKLLKSKRIDWQKVKLYVYPLESIEQAKALERELIELNLQDSDCCNTKRG